MSRKLAVVGLFVLSACAAQQPTPTSCVVARESGFVGGGAPPERITVLQNAQPCEMETMIGRGSVDAGSIVTPPMHGVATVRLSNGTSLIGYTPARDYIGSDRFVLSFGPSFSETVNVQVVPSAAKP
jgi:hypothetical protein